MPGWEGEVLGTGTLKSQVESKLPCYPLCSERAVGVSLSNSVSAGSFVVSCTLVLISFLLGGVLCFPIILQFFSITFHFTLGIFFLFKLTICTAMICLILVG